ncbi:MAG: elongation factor P [Candidatus Omnitrophica bacterium]|nr:elongation factor P [Candidatus Omnitrophota bacterium]
MPIQIGSIRPSMSLIYNGMPHIVVNCEHAKLGRGAAFCRVKLRNMKNAQVIDVTLRYSDKVEAAFIEKKTLQYLYNDGEQYHFLDMETYEELILREELLADVKDMLQDNLELSGLSYENELVSLELPLSLEFKITETEPGVRGDTVKAGTKPAKISTGMVIMVPLFVNTGDVVKIDTKTREYLGKV